MATTTDIAAWLDDNEPADEQDRQDLLNSLRNVEIRGNYSTTKRSSKLLIKGWTDDGLLLDGKRAKAALVREVEVLRFDDDAGQTFRNVT